MYFDGPAYGLRFLRLSACHLQVSLGTEALMCQDLIHLFFADRSFRAGAVASRALSLPRGRRRAGRGGAARRHGPAQACWHGLLAWHA